MYRKTQAKSGSASNNHRSVSKAEFLGIARSQHEVEISRTALKEVLPKLPVSWKEQSGPISPVRIIEEKIPAVIERVGTKLAVPKDYYTLSEVSREARNQGFEVSTIVLNHKVNSWVREFKKNPVKDSPVIGVVSSRMGKKHKVLVPKATKDALIEWRRNLGLPSGYYTIETFFRQAQAAGLNPSREIVSRKLRAWLKQSKASGAKSVAIIIRDNHPKKRVIFDERVRLDLLKWLRTLRELPTFRRVGHVATVSDIAREFNTSIAAVHTIPGLQTMKVGNRAVLSEENAAYARAYLNEGNHRSGQGNTTRLVPPSIKQTWRVLDFWDKNVKLGVQKAAENFGNEKLFIDIVSGKKRGWRKVNSRTFVLFVRNWKAQAKSPQELASIGRLEEYLRRNPQELSN